MSIRLTPEYLGEDFGKAFPGHRFGMYFAPYGIDKSNKVSALKKSTSMPATAKAMAAALRARQLSIFSMLPKNKACLLAAASTAPFTTGLGNEHPLENGFAFLNPYGLPYLSGSGVKGTLRRAAEELAHAEFFGNPRDWSLPDIWRLFGFERWAKPTDNAGQTSLRAWQRWVDGFSVSRVEINNYLDSVLTHDPVERARLQDLLDNDQDDTHRLRSLVDQSTLHFRGALKFWDVIPDIGSQDLGIEVMTPHQSHYYRQEPFQGSCTPHESGKPNPSVIFLTVPIKSTFIFYIDCDLSHLSHTAPHLAQNERWKSLVRAAFKHAIEWIGFGAKTSIGYGVMQHDLKNERAVENRVRRDTRRRVAIEKTRKEAIDRRGRASQMDPMEREFEEIFRSRRDKKMPELTVLFNELRANRWTGTTRLQAAKLLRSRMQKTGSWVEKSRKKNPIKDKNHQRTLFILKCLDDK